MKSKLNKISLFLATILAAGLTAARADVGYSVFATPGTAYNAATSYAVIPMQTSVGGPNGAAPLITYLNYSGLSANAITLTAYVSTNRTVALATNSANTLTVNATNGFTAGQVVLIQHAGLGLLPRFQSEYAVVSAVQNTNQIVLATNAVNPVVPGDIVWQETSAGSIPVASSTSAQSLIGPGILAGDRREPFLLVLSSSNGTNSINTACATYVP